MAALSIASVKEREPPWMAQALLSLKYRRMGEQFFPGSTDTKTSYLGAFIFIPDKGSFPFVLEQCFRLLFLFSHTIDSYR